MTFAKALALPTELAVIGFSDAVIDAIGYRPDHPYAETTRSKHIFELSDFSENDRARRCVLIVSFFLLCVF